MPPPTRETLIRMQEEQQAQRPDPFQTSAARFVSVINQGIAQAMAQLKPKEEPPKKPEQTEQKVSQAAASQSNSQPQPAAVSAAPVGEIIEGVVINETPSQQRGDTQPFRLNAPFNERVFREGQVWVLLVDLLPEWANFGEKNMRLAMTMWTRRGNPPHRYRIIGRRKRMAGVEFFRNQEVVFDVLSELEHYSPDLR